MIEKPEKLSFRHACRLVVGNEFGRAKRGAKPEPHGCGEPIQAMDGSQSVVHGLILATC